MERHSHAHQRGAGHLWHPEAAALSRVGAGEQTPGAGTGLDTNSEGTVEYKGYDERILNRDSIRLTVQVILPI